MKNEKIIREILDLKQDIEIDIDDGIDEYGFDSLTAINLITYLSDNSIVEIDPEEMESFITIGDLDNFISSKLK